MSVLKPIAILLSSLGITAIAIWISALATRALYSLSQNLSGVDLRYYTIALILTSSSILCYIGLVKFRKTNN